MDERRITVSLQTQQLMAWEGDTLWRRFEVSTGAAGAGCQSGSGCTPTGHHVIRACIGAGAPLNAVFVGRRPTGEIWTPALHARYPGRDWILTRILWLSGCEVGHNRLGEVDTMRRYIYIHGTPPVEPMGVPRSHGCIRMRSEDIVALFDWVRPGTPVEIVP